MNKRIFVRKKQGYNQEEIALKNSLNYEYELDLKELKLYNVYDIYNIDEQIYDIAKKSVFSEITVDEVFEELELIDNKYFAYETLPAQYDQRGDSAKQCIELLNGKSDVVVRSGTLITFDKTLNNTQISLLDKYLINPIESRKKNMNILENTVNKNIKPLKDLTGFINFTDDELKILKEEMSLAMNMEDLKFIQQYFRDEEIDPTETEIYVLDCYWSDHCRHTTFETILDDIKIESDLYYDEISKSLDIYYDMKKQLNNTKPQTLMDMASIVGKYHKQVLKDENIEVSEEINACSFFTDIKVNDNKEKWAIQFKNETHNHPTEIEPFGGASTCIGGAIRDPLSARSYVYQAMRVTGCGNILQNRKNTLKNKLPQVDISKKATHGYSSYGNQIGLTTTYVKELYDDSYVAKHLEVGAVVGAIKSDNLVRKTPTKGDIVLLIGGRTGRDGIQGASGSSIVHNDKSLETSSSQVQKGNAIEERKIQRLFRNPCVTKLIKKCNDFGAGGVCVAIGELSDSIEIYLDKILVKYEGLNSTELATSESQERMAVVICEKDYDYFIKECEKENIEYSLCAKITDENRLVMYHNGEKVVNLKSDFLATSGVRQHSSAVIKDNNKINPFLDVEVTKKNILKELASLNVTCQRGIAQRFDASINASTVVMPFAGKYQLTPTQSSVQAIPMIKGTTDTATVLTYGFIPKISYYSPFLSSIYALLESVAKVFAIGGNSDNLYFSFQEYFESLGKDKTKWGKVVQSILGSIYAQKFINRPSIGGKDSMSGTFNDLNVVETLISFACTTTKIDNVITPELKKVGNFLYYIPVVKNNKNFPDISKTMENYKQVAKLIEDKKIISAYVQEEGSIVASLVKMAMGNKLGFDVKKDNILNFEPASMIVESPFELPFEKIGVVADDYKVNGICLSYDELYNSYTNTLNEIYPLYQNLDKTNCENINQSTTDKKFYDKDVDKVKVLIPVFPGTNCEYDMAKAFYNKDVEVKTLVFKNKNAEDIKQSIKELAKEIANCHIIALAGGFSSGDEPDGSAKFIVNVFKNEEIKKLINKHVQDKKLIIGICNGFQALIKSGLLPYGEIRDLTEDDLTLYRNDSYQHISCSVVTRVSNTTSPWTQDFKLGEMHEVMVSHGEGKLVGKDIEKFKHLATFQYCDFDGNATMNGVYNPNGSLYAIEGMISENGLIIGKMAHSERYGKGLYKTSHYQNQKDIFSSAINYFKGSKL